MLTDVVKVKPDFDEDSIVYEHDLTTRLPENLFECIQNSNPEIGYVKNRMTLQLDRIIREQIPKNNTYRYPFPHHEFHNLNYISVLDGDINSFIYIELMCDDDWYLVSLTHPADKGHHLWKCDQLGGVVAFIQRLYSCP
jgi:hypothetical protein